MTAVRQWCHRQRWPLGLMFGALVVRLWWVLSVTRGGLAFNDTYFYDFGARSIAHGQGYLLAEGLPNAQWPPGYSAVLAGLYRVFGARTLVAEIFNATVGALTVPVLYGTVKRHFGHRVAVIAGVIVGVLPGCVLWTDLVLSETFSVFLFVCFIALTVRSSPTWRWALLLGVFVAGAALVRGEALLWLLIPIVLWWRQAGWKVVLRRIAVTFAAIVVVFTPWVIRNYSVFHHFVPLATNSSGTLWAGHNPAATGMQSLPSNEHVEALAGDSVDPERFVVVANGMRREALQWMVHHPVQEVTLIPRKILGLLRGDSHAFEWLNTPPYPANSPSTIMLVGTVADAAWFMLLGLFVVGLIAFRRRMWREPLLLAISVSVATALVLYGFLYYGNYRYHLQYEPLMAVVAALVLDRMWTALRNTTTA
jgi:4-amino-4-deoxy-L-arabinose transferase-like glycosyltransferase